jgi:adenine-specific DNA-methyltransferase
MTQRMLKIDDLRDLTTPDKIAKIFQQLGYTASAELIDIKSLDLSPRSEEAIASGYLIADQNSGGLQVILFELKASEWDSPSVASGRMKAIASQLGKRPSEFLLLATKDYNQLMLVNPRKSFDEKSNLQASIRKLLIDRQNPTAYDLDRLEAIAVRGRSAREIYQAQCEAFDVEKLTKGFYSGYENLFKRVLQVIKDYNPHTYFEDKDRLYQFTQRLLGRIMFLYFLQQKEFLAGDRRFLTTQYKVNKYQADGQDYYAEILEPLFFQTLNQQRDNHQSQWGQIPYLNGGLFDRDYGANIKDGAGRETPEFITLPNSIFDPGDSKSIIGFFNSYNFTVAENVTGDEDVAVDPEMLGKVFENMLVAEERGKSGTFYTPRGIVQFICAEVLGRYLADRTGIALEKAQKLVTYDPEISDKDLNELISPQDTKSLKKALIDVRVLDPAVGSGAFPLGMMQLILNVRQAVARREGMTVQRGSLAISEWKREIIANNLYGVDIKPEAIEIAKLRMWLSLVVDIPTIENVEALPNLDYKLMCGDSLISKINGQTIIPIPGQAQQLTLGFEMTELDKAIADLLKLEKQYFNVSSEERQDLRLQILEAEKRVFVGAIADQRHVILAQQKQLEKEIKQFKKPEKQQLQEREQLAARLAGLDEFESQVKRGDRSLNFFQYYLHFRDVFEQKGGFDLVIGNPPYVRQEQIKELKPALKEEYDCYTGVADLYVYFYEQGFRLLKEKGYLSFITSNKYFRAGYGEKLRKYLGAKSTIEVMIDFGDANVFEAIAYPSIIVFKKEKPNEHQAAVLTWQAGQALEDFVSVYQKNAFPLEQTELKPDGWRLESSKVLSLLDRLRNAGTPLGEYVNGRFYYGIKTGFNEAFVVDRETRDRLIAEHPSSAEVLKPFLRGRDVKRWSVENPDLWLIFIPWHFPLHRDSSISGVSEKAEEKFALNYPAIYNHLLIYKKQLSNRNQSETGIRYEWYALQRCAASYWQEFEKTKILYPDIAESCNFTAIFNNSYLDCTCFFIPVEIFYLLGILNSAIINFWFSSICPKVRGNFMRFKSIYVEQIPIPKASEADKQAIEKLVEKCLAAKGVGVEEWEAEIDDRVAHLYGLTAEDMKIIKGDG